MLSRRASEPQSELSPTQQAARWLHQLGLNPIPQPFGAKSGFPWKASQHTRLDLNHKKTGINQVFAGQVNIAVITGKISRNLFILDCETPRAFNHHIKEVRKRGLPLWATWTNRGGHIWFFCATGEVKNSSAGATPTLSETEIRGQSNSYILVPPSLHPNGSVYSWHSRDGIEPPTVTPEELDWLPLEVEAADPGLIPKLGDITDFSPLSRHTNEYIAGNLESPDYPDNDLYAAACDCLGNGYDENATFRMLEPTATQSGLSETNIWRNIHNAAANDPEPARKYAGRSYEIPHWHLARSYATKYISSWKGRTGSTDHKVFLALINCAKRGANASGTFRASNRELAEMIDTQPKTVRNSLKRLRGSTNQHGVPLIKYAGRDKQSNANLYRFTNTVLHAQSDTSVMTPLHLDPFREFFNGVIAKSKLMSLLLHPNALGIFACEIYGFLAESGNAYLQKELADLFKCPRSRIHSAMKKLREYGLIRHLGRRMGYEAVQWHEVDQAYIQYKIERSGASGARAKLRSRHEAERSVYLGRQLLLYREEHDDHHLPVEMQPPRNWRCGDCLTMIKSRAAYLPDHCPHCGVKPKWERRKIRQKPPKTASKRKSS